MSVRMLVLPVLGNRWLYHAWVVSKQSNIHSSVAIDWSQGKSVQEKLQLLGNQVSSKVSKSLSNQWEQVESAKHGSFKHRLYQLAQYVLSREDPLETCLKSIPTNTLDAEILYPASLHPALVRRRTRRMARYRGAYHERRMVGWALATLPQLPLALTPLPNVTVYYSLYRLISHYQARNGAHALSNLFRQHDAHQLHLMHDYVAALARDGRTFPAGSWPDKLLRKDDRYMDLLADLEHKARQQLGLEPNVPPQPRFVPDAFLDEVVRPLDRQQKPLSEAAVMAISEHYSLPRLPEHVARLRKMADKGTR